MNQIILNITIENEELPQIISNIQMGEDVNIMGAVQPEKLTEIDVKFINDLKSR